MQENAAFPCIAVSNGAPVIDKCDVSAGPMPCVVVESQVCPVLCCGRSQALCCVGGACARRRRAVLCGFCGAIMAHPLQAQGFPSLEVAGGWGRRVFNSEEVNRAPQNWGGGREKGSIDRTINQLLEILALREPKIFWSIENDQILFHQTHGKCLLL